MSAEDSPESNRVTALREHLKTLDPVRLDIRDDSAQHAGHAGAREGGHFAVLIVSARFSGLSTVQRHRLVYDAASVMLQNGVHALSITAKSPDETQPDSL